MILGNLQLCTLLQICFKDACDQISYCCPKQFNPRKRNPGGMCWIYSSILAHELGVIEHCGEGSTTPFLIVRSAKSLLSMVISHYITGWWFGTFFCFSTYIGNNNLNWLSYFSEGWLNHQADQITSHSKMPHFCRSNAAPNPLFSPVKAAETARNQWPFQDPKLEVPIPYIRPIFQAYVREYPHNSYGLKYGTNVPPSIGSWIFHWS